jgi:KUP system potassium uptake protein
MWRVWKVHIAVAALVVSVFLAIDLSFLGANIAKIADGGWVPLSVGSAAFALTMVWRWGRRKIAVRLLAKTVPIEDFIARDDVKGSNRVAGTNVYLTSAIEGVPPILTHHFERIGVLREQIVLLSIQTLDIPFVEPKRRLAYTDLGSGFHRVVARFGYAESPNVPIVLEASAILGLVVDFDHVTYVLGRDALRLRYQHGPLSIHRRIFAFLSRNQASTFGYFDMPVERVIEIGMQLEL